MIAENGKPIPLGVSLSKNGIPLSGETITVRVIDPKDGAEKLAVTNLTETSEPGVYFFNWTTPPIDIPTLLAKYVTKSIEFEEIITVVRFVAEKTDIIGEIKISNVIDGEIESSSLEGEIELNQVEGELNGENLEGELQSDLIEGET